jgi:hypothetical protein
MCIFELLSFFISVDPLSAETEYGIMKKADDLSIITLPFDLAYTTMDKFREKKSYILA